MGVFMIVGGGMYGVLMIVGGGRMGALMMVGAESMGADLMIVGAKSKPGAAKAAGSAMRNSP